MGKKAEKQKTVPKNISEKELRKNSRKDKGSLKDQQVTRRVREKYVKLSHEVLNYWETMGVCPSIPEFDEHLTEYVEMLYAEGDAYDNATSTLAAIQFHFPEPIGHLRHSWKMCQVWKRIEPPARVKPFTPLMVLGIAGALYSLDMTGLAALVAIGFDGFLRTGELFALQPLSVSFYPDKAVLRLSNTKTSLCKGVDEMVVIESEIACKLLRLACQDRHAGKPILDISVWRARRVFLQILNMFELSPKEFNFYSLRRGGATSFFYKTGSMEQTLATGRWQSVATARLYIQDAAAQAAELSLSSSQRQKIEEAAKALRRL